MKLLKKIGNENIDIKEFREASRGIFKDEYNLIPILFVSKHNYFKLPWGWIELQENEEQALIRECKEEIGCQIEISWKIWKIIEYKQEIWQKQISYCYYWKIIEKWKPCFTMEEQENGFEIVWMKIDEALNGFKEKTPTSSIWHFILKRDLIFLHEYKNIISWNQEN